MSDAKDDPLTEVRRLLRERAGIEPDSLGRAAIVHAVRNRVRADQNESMDSYLRRLTSDANEFQALLEDLVVPETWFFRDTQAFRQLDAYVKSWASSKQATLRVLSVACSTGEEVYSLAIAIREAGLTPTRFGIIGTDISRRALDFARSGMYASRSFRQSDSPASDRVRDTWFQFADGNWRIRDELRGGIEFTTGNLSSPDFLAAASPFHVIFCRNVLIYLHPQARQVATRNLQRLLSRDGMLLSAPAEARIFTESGFASSAANYPSAFRHGQAGSGARSILEPTKREPAMLPAATSPLHVATVPVRPPVVARKDRTTAVPLAIVTPHAMAPGKAMLAAARNAADLGRLDEAESLCNELLSGDAASAEAYYLRGLVRQALGDPSEAQRCLEKALYLQPKHHETLVQLMLLAEMRGDQRAAANYRRRAEQIAPPEAKP